MVLGGGTGTDGVGNGAQWVSAVTAIQHSVSATVQSSVMALLGAIAQLMPALGFLLGGALATIGSPRTAYAGAAAGVLLTLLVVAARPPRGLDV